MLWVCGCRIAKIYPPATTTCSMRSSRTHSQVPALISPYLTVIALLICFHSSLSLSLSLPACVSLSRSV